MDDASAQRLHLSQRPRGDHLPQSKAGRKSPPDHGREGGAPPAERRTETANPLPLLRCWTARERRAKRPKNEAHARARRPRTPPGPTTTAPCQQHTPSAREASTLRTSDPRPHPASRRPAMQSLGAPAAERAVVGWLLPATRVSELDRPTAASPPMTTRTFVRSPHQQPHSPNRLGTGAKNPLNRPGGLSAIRQPQPKSRYAAREQGSMVPQPVPAGVFPEPEVVGSNPVGRVNEARSQSGVSVCPWSRASRLQ